MKYVYPFVITTIAIIFLSFIKPHVVEFKLVQDESSVNWHAEKVTGSHDGTISFSKGQLNFDHGKYYGTFEMDMTTITVTDLKGGSKEKLEKHLKSADFFDVENHPTSSLRVHSIKRNPNGTYKIDGKLTIKGISNDIAFDTAMSKSDGELQFKGELTVDRTMYDIKYRSQKFFEDIGDKMIYDDFTLLFDVSLKK